MATLLRMPEISANTVEAVLSEWPLAENSAFAAGDAIATVETEKAVVDVPADADGVLLRTLVEPGKSVSVGTPMAVLAAPGEVVDDVDALVDRLTGTPPRAVPAAAAGAPSPAGTREASQHAEPAAAARIFASPLARRIARENGIAVGDLHGTGPGGRIVRDDVRRAISDRLAATPEQRRPDIPDGRPVDATATIAAAFEDVPHSRMRRAIAARLTHSHQEAPVFSIRGSARVDALLVLREDLNAAAGVKVSINDLIVAAAARAHVAVPDMNVIWTTDAVRHFHNVDIAVAVATNSGLVTPVLRGVQRMTVSALASTSADLVARARDGRLRQDELEGGTLTVTNLGVFGTEDFTAVINPPQAAILAVGAARQEPVVADGELGVATVLRATLSVDHRPVDGATGARWMAYFLGLLETPLRILA
ncbi:MAG TPA: dihydrolipoamide acetyltransferase family protein [Actinoplanes sp.]|nr:dihydrolipoamide acetyltransferase family protein [Actinoplanes sp.]